MSWKSFDAAKDLDQKLVDTYKKAGVEVVKMNEDQYKAWLEIAQRSSYKSFAEDVPGGDVIIEKALAVE